MTATIEGSDVLGAPLVALVPPTLRSVLGRTALTVATAVIAPAALFAVTLASFNLVIAVCVAFSWTLGATCWRHATGRPVSGLLLLTLGIMTVRTAFMLATGNAFIYFAQPIVADALVAMVFLGSLLTARPVVARLAGEFYPLDDELAARPAMCSLFRRLTLMWGLVVVTKGSITMWLLLSESTLHFVVIKTAVITTLTLTAVAATIALAAAVGRREGLLPAREPQKIE